MMNGPKFRPRQQPTCKAEAMERRKVLRSPFHQTTGTRWGPWAHHGSPETSRPGRRDARRLDCRHHSGLVGFLRSLGLGFRRQP